MSLAVAMASELITNERIGSAMGLMGTVSAAGTALGPSLDGVLVSALGWPAVPDADPARDALPPGDIPLHRAKLTKLTLILPVAAILPLWPAPVLLATAALALAAGFAAGIGPALLRRLMAPIGIALAVVHGLLIYRGPP